MSLVAALLAGASSRVDVSRSITDRRAMAATVACVMFNRRVHANNMYIERAVSGGLVGGAAFAWLCWAAARQLAKAVRRGPGAPLDSAAAALAAATMAIGLHGLVDSFLSFTATYILIAVTLGLTSASLTLTGTHAHRI